MYMSDNSLIKNVLKLIPPILMLLGVVFMVSGVFNQGALVLTRVFVFIVGLFASTFSYLIIHDKIKIARYFRNN